MSDIPDEIMHLDHASVILSLFEKAPFAITVTEPISGRLLYANRTTYDIYGLEYEIDSRRTLYSTDFYIDVEARNEIVRQLNEAGIASDVVIEMKPKGGESRYMSFSAVMIDFMGRKAILSAQFDMTVRFLAERALHENEAALSEANARLNDMVRALAEANAKLEEEKILHQKTIAEQESLLGQIETLKGMLPICASCKKIKDEEGMWHHVEEYIRTRSRAEFTHSICPECFRSLYPELAVKDK